MDKYKCVLVAHKPDSHEYGDHYSSDIDFRIIESKDDLISHIIHFETIIFDYREAGYDYYIIVNNDYEDYHGSDYSQETWTEICNSVAKIGEQRKKEKQLADKREKKAIERKKAIDERKEFNRLKKKFETELK